MVKHSVMQAKFKLYDRQEPLRQLSRLHARRAMLGIMISDRGRASGDVRSVGAKRLK